LTGQFQFCVKQAVEIESKMTSVERLVYYKQLEPEDEPPKDPEDSDEKEEEDSNSNSKSGSSFKTKTKTKTKTKSKSKSKPLVKLTLKDRLFGNDQSSSNAKLISSSSSHSLSHFFTPSNDWPKTGKIVFDNFSLKYKEGLPNVLNQICLIIPDKAKIGVVGRTGAGKSTLTSALFRLVEGCEGRILIDDVDISKLHLETLRSKLAIIPQDPVLFIGTIRSNLDPMGIHDDEAIWRVLQQVYFSEAVSALPLKLDHEIEENGENLSQGQRQMICLARALIRGSKIIIMDEATASVDLETDNQIQKAIRESFKDCTVITVAHRLNTIIDSDMVLVLDQGKVCEYDTPESLLSRPDSMFSSLVDETGKANADFLRAAARKEVTLFQ